MRILALLVMLGLALGTVLAPDVLLQVVFRGGFLLGGIAIAIALRPTDHAPISLPTAIVLPKSQKT